MQLCEIKEMFLKLDIEKGDTVMVSSELLGLWAECRDSEEGFEPEKILTYLQEILTEEGTLLIPTYSWTFSNGTGFDYCKSKSKTGMLGDVALKMEGFKRTLHPLYSFAVWGKNQQTFLDMNNTDSFGEDSPFAYFYQHNVKNLMIDVTYPKCLTFIHYVEQREGMDYRFVKNFTGPYVDECGKESIRTYSMFVRKLDLDVEFVKELHSFLVTSIPASVVSNSGIEMRCIQFGDAYTVLQKDMLENKARNIVRYIGQ